MFTATWTLRREVETIYRNLRLERKHEDAAAVRAAFPENPRSKAANAMRTALKAQRAADEASLYEQAVELSLAIREHKRESAVLVEQKRERRAARPAVPVSKRGRRYTGSAATSRYRRVRNQRESRPRMSPNRTAGPVFGIHAQPAPSRVHFSRFEPSKEARNDDIYAKVSQHFGTPRALVPTPGHLGRRTVTSLGQNRCTPTHENRYRNDAVSWTSSHTRVQR